MLHTSLHTSDAGQPPGLAVPTTSRLFPTHGLQGDTQEPKNPSQRAPEKGKTPALHTHQKSCSEQMEGETPRATSTKTRAATENPFAQLHSTIERTPKGKNSQSKVNKPIKRLIYFGYGDNRLSPYPNIDVNRCASEFLRKR